MPLWVKLLGGIGVLAAAIASLAFVPTGEVAYVPVAPIDLEGRIRLDGAPLDPLQGRLYLVGVKERKVNVLQRVLLDVGDPHVDFGPEPKERSKGPSSQDVEAMTNQKDVAAGVAFDLAGEPVTWSGNGATIAEVLPGLPAAAAGLRPGDIVVRVNGVEVDTDVEAGQRINTLPPGSRVVLHLRRAGAALRVTLRTVPPAPHDTVNRSRVGFTLTTLGLRVALGRDVSINSGEVVGPSAGLAFALYLYDALERDRDLLRGRHVVATGALSPDGQVVPVGRMRQKATAAQLANHDVLLVPRQNLEEAAAAVTRACGGEPARCVRVVPVGSIQEAIELLLLPDADLESQLAA